MNKLLAGLCLMAAGMAPIAAMAQLKDPARARLKAEIAAADARLFGGLNARHRPDEGRIHGGQWKLLRVLSYDH